jgi:hypothetical protein
MAQPSLDRSGFSLVALLATLAAVVTLAVGADFALRGLGIDLIELNLPRRGLWSLLIGVCCLGTAWFAMEGTSAMRRKR